MAEGSRMLVIGLDGATWDLIKPWADEGKLPTFKKLMENGVWGELESTVPPWTVPAWNCLSAGKRPEKLGLTTFRQRETGSYKFRPCFVTKNPGTCFWDCLNDGEKRTHLLFLPNVHNPYKINGLMITGWLYENRDKLTFPPDLKAKLEKAVGKFKIDVAELDEKGGARTKIMTDKQYVNEVRDITEKHFDILKHILINYEWDTVFIVFAGSDRLQHRFWERKNLILDYYKDIDNKINELSELINDDTYIMLVSDHGFGRSDYAFNVNDWLIKEGYLSLETGNSNPSLLRRIYNLASKNKRLHSMMIKAAVPLPRFKGMLEKKLNPKNFEDLEINWGNTKAFAYGCFGDVYLNLAGREPCGAVEVREYDRVRDEIIDKLKALSPPETGKKLSVKVFKKEELYSDCTIKDTKPDIFILVTDAGIQRISPGVGTGQIFQRSIRGMHRLNGIFLCHGPDIKKGKITRKARIYDIAPTVLHMFGLPIPKDMDGRVLKEIFEEDSELAKREIVYQAVNEREKISKRIKELKTLGKI